MKVWIEVLTPKQALFFEPLYRALRQRGHDALITTRVYREAEQTLKLKKLRFSVVGTHGGGTAFGKLTASAERVTKLANLIHQSRHLGLHSALGYHTLRQMTRHTLGWWQG